MFIDYDYDFNFQKVKDAQNNCIYCGKKTDLAVDDIPICQNCIKFDQECICSTIEKNSSVYIDLWPGSVLKTVYKKRLVG